MLQYRSVCSGISWSWLGEGVGATALKHRAMVKDKIARFGVSLNRSLLTGEALYRPAVSSPWSSFIKGERQKVGGQAALQSCSCLARPSFLDAA
jgi:hypothetical protein